MPLQRLSGEEHLRGEVALLDDLNKALDKIEFNTWTIAWRKVST